jgi:hypothetical protein
MPSFFLDEVILSTIESHFESLLNLLYQIILKLKIYCGIIKEKDVREQSS